jgi:hypothetical protein
MEPWSLVFTFIVPRLLISLCTMMLIGPDVLRLAVPPLATASFSVIIWFLGPPSVKRLYPDPVQRLSIVLLLMGLRRHAGYGTFYLSSIALFDELLLCIVTMSVPFIYLPTPFSTSGLSTWRSIYTSFVTTSPLERFEFYMCLPPHSMPTSSPRGSRRPSSSSLGPVLMSVMLPVLTAGEC